MQMLENDWLTNDPIDFEYKKYKLLAYSQQQTKFYNQQKLYPNFLDVIEKMKIVNQFLGNVKLLEESKVQVKDIDWSSKKIIYESEINDVMLDEIKSIASFSKEILVELYTKYRDLFEDVENSISISGCRVEIFNLYDGYIILRGVGKEKILEYEVFRRLHPEPSYVLKTGKANMKDYYANRYTKNVFDVIFTKHYPMKQSILPVYKRKFLQSLFGFNN